jgi:hypothetical protein
MLCRTSGVLFRSDLDDPFFGLARRIFHDGMNNSGEGDFAERHFCLPSAELGIATTSCFDGLGRFRSAWAVRAKSRPQSCKRCRAAIVHRPCPNPSRVTRLRERLPDKAVVGSGLLAPGGHSVSGYSTAILHMREAAALLFPALCVHLNMKQGIGKLVCDFQLPSLARLKIAVHILKNLAGHYRRFFPGCVLVGQFLTVVVGMVFLA